MYMYEGMTSSIYEAKSGRPSCMRFLFCRRTSFSSNMNVQAGVHLLYIFCTALFLFIFVQGRNIFFFFFLLHLGEKNEGQAKKAGEQEQEQAGIMART